MKKQLPVILCVILLLTLAVSPAYAVETTEVVVDLGDGFYMVSTLSQYQTFSGTAKYGSRTSDLYYDSTQIGTATLYASFDLSGSTAVATSAYLSGSGMNGWTYSPGSTRCSGNTAYGTACFSKDNVLKSSTVTLSCSPDGTLY